jgi:hypothetical protein
VTLPQQTTGTGAREPGRDTRRAVMAAVTAASGDSRRGVSAPPPLYQNAGT